MVEATALLDGLGVAMTESPREASTPEAWLAAAHNRPQWLLWGKAKPTGVCPAHPMMSHMLDVAAVAAVMLTRTLAPSLRRRLLSAVDGDESQALRTLLFVIALHDLGKASPAFQTKVAWAETLLPTHGFDLNAPRDARHHGDLGYCLLLDVLVARGATASTARALARAVAAHHGQFPTDSQYAKGVAARERGKAPHWQTSRDVIVSEFADFFEITTLPTFTFDHAWVALLAGLTSVADWVGSMDEVFVYETAPQSLKSYWPRALARAEIALARAGFSEHEERPSESTFSGLFPSYSPWPLHTEADRIAGTLDAPSLVLIEAPMGEGKTEAALVLANASAARVQTHGLYFGLPTQATANQILGRLQEFLTRTRKHSTLVLAHGEADLNERFTKLSAVYDPSDTLGGERADGVRAQRWFLSKKRTLLAEYGVGTIDQTLLSVMRTGHLFVRLFGLASKTVILDEVHAYDTYTGTLLDRLLAWLGALGATVVLLSATLPSSRRRELVRAYRLGAGASPVDLTHEPPVVSYPRITTASAHSLSEHTFAPRGEPVAVTLARVDDDLNDIAQTVRNTVQTQGGCIGWICNTVARAQAAYEALGTLEDVTVLLMHARLLPEDRAARERALEAMLGPEKPSVSRPTRCVVIGTQVLEQSLDIDFDWLVTDVAPIDLLLQRAGRLQRHRRSNRNTHYPTPKLTLAAPSGHWAKVSLRGLAGVYAEAIVRQTLRVLEGRQTVTLPDDIEPLVEQVYLHALPPSTDPLHEVFVAFEGEQRAANQDARKRLIPLPTDEDDLYGSLQVHFDDSDDPTLHEQLRAVTRSGPPSVDIVCLVQRGESLFADEACTVPVSLDKEPDRALTRALVRRTIGVSRPALVSKLLHDASAAPEPWKRNALLRFRRVVAFADGVAVVGSTRLVLDPVLGLCLSNA
ncbi:MAG: CRISPR-associated helicase Cas3' [Deltaproteobacteria bacterium]|nr:CRISPR-associated helicase Cas3' [Deltaproteobacteria bacterium]